MAEGLSKSYVNTHDPNHPVQEDLVLYQLFEKARQEGHVGEIVNLETDTRHLTTDLLDKADEYAKGLLAIGYIPGEDNLAVIGCATVEALCLFAAANSIGVGFGQPYIYDPKELSISRTVPLLRPKAVVVGEGSSGTVFSALVNLFEDTETPQSEKLPFVKHVFYDNTHRARSPQQKYIKSLDKLRELGESTTDGQLMEARKLVKPDFVAHHLFTSGSTGHSKCVAHMHKSLVNEYLLLEINGPMLALSANVDELICYTCVGAVLSGLALKVVITPDLIIDDAGLERMSRRCTEAILEEGIQYIALPGSIAQLVATYVTSNHIQLPPVTSFVIGGQSVSRQFKENLLKALNAKIIFNSYGMSEVGTIAYSRLGDNAADEEDRLENRLYPKRNSELRMVDENNQIVDIGKTGEVQLKNFSMFKRYVSMEETTSQMFTSDGFLRTGDMAVMHPDGTFNVNGRRSDAIRFKVFTDVVYPGPIEMVIGKHPLCADVSVVAGKLSDIIGDEVTYCIRLKREADKPTEEELFEFIMENGCTDQQVPARIIYMEKFPTTANSRKVSKQLLREQVQDMIKHEPDVGITEWYRQILEDKKMKQ